jgi:hypothetical protein
MNSDMATKAEEFRASTQQSSKARSPRSKASGQTAAPNGKRRKRIAGKGVTSTRAKNESGRAGRKASFAAEQPAPSGKVSRKSSRGSANRAKPDSNLQRRQKRRIHTPEERAARANDRAR